jgi:hypothetical protein
MGASADSSLRLNIAAGGHDKLSDSPAACVTSRFGRILRWQRAGRDCAKSLHKFALRVSTSPVPMRAAPRWSTPIAKLLAKPEWPGSADARTGFYSHPVIVPKIPPFQQDPPRPKAEQSRALRFYPLGLPPCSARQHSAKEFSMKRATLLSITAAGLLLGSAAAYAQSSSSPSSPSSPGASGFAPGQQDRTGTDRGASSFAPGQMQKSGEGSAKEFAPGQQMKNPATTGSSTSTDTKTKKNETEQK